MASSWPAELSASPGSFTQLFCSLPSPPAACPEPASWQSACSGAQLGKLPSLCSRLTAFQSARCQRNARSQQPAGQVQQHCPASGADLPQKCKPCPAAGAAHRLAAGHQCCAGAVRGWQGLHSRQLAGCRQLASPVRGTTEQPCGQAAISGLANEDPGGRQGEPPLLRLLPAPVNISRYRWKCSTDGSIAQSSQSLPGLPPCQKFVHCLGYSWSAGCRPRSSTLIIQHRHHQSLKTSHRH